MKYHFFPSFISRPNYKDIFLKYPNKDLRISKMVRGSMSKVIVYVVF